MRPILAALVALVGIAGPAASAVSAQDALPKPEFTPFTVAPALLNKEEVVQALIREYPAELREQGIGGRVNVWFYVTADGRVQYPQIDTSSGLDALDEAAMRVADVYEFSPAMNRDSRVAVWISLPITFAAQRRPDGNPTGA